VAGHSINFTRILANDPGKFDGVALESSMGQVELRD
jgi:hypothetical protein